jgi:hypothetical protein
MPRKPKGVPAPEYTTLEEIGRSATERHRVWIELGPPRDKRHAKTVTALANRMLTRLVKPGDPCGTFDYDEKRNLYDYGTDMGRETLVDHGKWFSLDYFGRAA